MSRALGLHTFRTAKAKPSIELKRISIRTSIQNQADNSQSRIVSLELGLVPHRRQLGVITLEMFIFHCDRQAVKLKTKLKLYGWRFAAGSTAYYILKMVISTCKAVTQLKYSQDSPDSSPDRRIHVNLRGAPTLVESGMSIPSISA